MVEKVFFFLHCKSLFLCPFLILHSQDTRKEFEEQVSKCLSLLLSSTPSFRYAHSENSVSPASQLSHMYNPWGDLEDGMEEDEE